MLSHGSPEQEAARIEALRRYDVLDTAAEQEFDDFTALASQICAVPISLLSLIDSDRQWFKSRVGLDAEQTPRDIAFCDHTIRSTDTLEVPDALEDPRFAENPLVTGAPHVRFYGGAPLTTPDGHNIGTLCVIDHVPRRLTPEQRDGLARLARQVIGRLELRRAMANTERAALEIRDLYDRAPCAYHSLDENGTFMAVNDTELHWLGYQREEVVGRLKFTELLTDGGRRTFEENFPRFKSQGHIEDLEFELVRKDGTLLPVRLSATAIVDAGGRYRQSRSTMFDNTARKRLQEERDRLFDVSLDLMCTADFGGRLLSVNPAFTRVLGWTREQLLARPFLELVHPDDLPATLAELDNLARGALTLNFENRYICKDGSWRWLSWRAAPDPARGVIVATARDETELRKARDSLKRSEEQHRVTLRSIGDAVLVTDTEGRITLLNAVAEALTGWAEHEAKGRPATEVLRIVHERSRDLVPSPVAAVLSSGQACDLANHTILVARDGTERSIADSAAPIHDARGGISGVVVVFRDATDARERSRALELSAERYRLALEASELGTFDWNMVTGALGVDDGFRRLLGRGLEYVDDVEATARELIWPEDVAVLMGLLAGVQDGSAPGLDTELRLRNATNQPLWGRILSRVTERDAAGRPVRMIGTIANIDARRRSEAERASQIERQSTLLAISTDLLKSSPGEVDPVVERALRTISTQLHAERALIFRREGDYTNNTHEWCAEGLAPQKELLQSLPLDVFAWSTGVLANGDALVVPDIDDMPDASVNVQREMRRVGVRSLLVLPLMESGKLGGTLSLSSYEGRTQWSSRDLAFVRLVADVICGALQRARSERALAELNRTLEARVAERTRALREAERAGGVGSFEFELGTGLVSWTEGLVRIYGHEPDSFTPTYQAFLDHIHPDDREDVMKETAAAIERGGRYEHTKRILRVDGEIRMLETHAEVMADADGRPTRVVGMCSDVTARHEAQRQRREALDTLDAADDGAFIFAPDTLRFLYVNEGAVRQLGYSRAEFLAMTPPDIKPEFDEQRFRELIAPLLRGDGNALSFTTLHRHKNGHDIPVELKVQLVTDENKPRFIAMVRDITERRAAEATVAQGLKRFQDLFEFAPDAILMTKADGTIQQINRQAEALFGYPRQELVGQPVEVLIPESLRGGHVALRQGFVGSPSVRAMGGGRAKLNGVKKDGTVFPIDISLGPMDSSEGTVVAAAVRDITDRVNADDALRDGLREKETLLKEIHHRVKNNLQIISSLLSMQADAAHEAATQSLLQESIHRVRSMALIHERLYQSTTLARIDFGEYTRSLTTFLFRSYKMSTAVDLKVDVEAAELNIETAVPLGLLLNELVSNALKHAFCDGRGGTLRVSLHPATVGFRLTVADTGPGLPDGFEIARAKSMGMTLVNSLARQLKADLVVTSDAGACFRVEFKELIYATR